MSLIHIYQDDFLIVNSARSSKVDYLNFKAVSNKNFSLYVHKDTLSKRYKYENFEIVVIGDYFCIDKVNEDVDLFASASASSERLFLELASIIDSFSGHFIFFVITDDDIRIVPDATATRPLFYSNIDNSVICGSSEILVSKVCESERALDKNPLFDRIPVGANLPYDLTGTNLIKQLLPNHYFSLCDGVAHRRKFNLLNNENSELKSITAYTATVLKRTCEYYAKKFKLICPLTGGYDSRVVFSALLSTQTASETYTFQHSRLPSNHDDIAVPPELSSFFDVEHRKLYHRQDTRLTELEGIWRARTTLPVNPSTIQNAATILSSYGTNVTILNGDIIGQIGKSSVGGCISNKFFTKRLIRSKNHYMSRSGLSYELDYINSLKGINAYWTDLYSWEIRCGKWAATTADFYRINGIQSINIFNCTNLIRMWCQIPREARVSGLFHQSLINQLMPEIELAYPVKISKKSIRNHPILYYIASLAKFYINRTSKAFRG